MEETKLNWIKNSRILFVIIVPLLLFSCKENSDFNPVYVTNEDTLSIDNSKVNFSVNYFWKKKSLKPLVKKDTITILVKYEKEMGKCVKRNFIEIVPNVHNCQILKVDNFTFYIILNQDYKDSILRWTMYLAPNKNTIFSVNEKKYYNFPDRIFIAEKTNLIDLK